MESRYNIMQRLLKGGQQSLENNQVKTQINADFIIAQCQEVINKLTIENIMLRAMLEQEKDMNAQKQSDNQVFACEMGWEWKCNHYDKFIMKGCHMY